MISIPLAATSFLAALLSVYLLPGNTRPLDSTVFPNDSLSALQCVISVGKHVIFINTNRRTLFRLWRLPQERGARNQPCKTVSVTFGQKGIFCIRKFVHQIEQYSITTMWNNKDMTKGAGGAMKSSSLSKNT